MISVITPLKNIISDGREPCFRIMMDTLFSQTYQDFEHIVVDGASDDGTLDLLEDYRKKGQINILISEQDKNVNDAMNKGLKVANGEYIHMMNSDNYFSTPLFFEMSLNAIEMHQVDFTHGDRVILPRNGGDPSVKKGDEQSAFFRMPFRYQTMLIRRSVYDEIGSFDITYKIAADFKFMIQILLAGKIGYYFPETFIHSLDGGITKDRQTVIAEVTRVLFECYGERYGLSLEDCRNIYLKTISHELFSKINANVKDVRILQSLTYCYQLSNESKEWDKPI